MPLNRNLIDAARNLPHEPEPNVLGAGPRPTPYDLAVNGDRDELARRCRAELSPEAFELAAAWANAVEAETGDYYTDAHVKKVALVAKHFPTFEAAIRAISEHVETERAPDGLNAWPACCAWPAVDGEESDDPVV